MKGFIGLLVGFFLAVFCSSAYGHAPGSKTNLPKIEVSYPTIQVTPLTQIHSDTTALVGPVTVRLLSPVGILPDVLVISKYVSDYPVILKIGEERQRQGYKGYNYAVRKL